MALLPILLLFLGLTGSSEFVFLLLEWCGSGHEGHHNGAQDATWCICKSDVSEKTLQTTLDYACGAGADCTPIHQKGACFDPNTVKDHCSYAANSYFQKSGQSSGSCDFSGTAQMTNNDPSGGSCKYPSSPGAAGSGGVGTTPTSTTTPTTPGGVGTNSPFTSSPNGFTPANGGILGGIGPSGVGITTDGTGSNAPSLPTTTKAAASLLTILVLTTLF